jgi:hypothetical protein
VDSVEIPYRCHAPLGRKPAIVYVAENFHYESQVLNGRAVELQRPFRR